MLRRNVDTNREDSGFTLIELLVVVIIIGILAAIAVPVFLDQKKRGYDASIKSDLRNVATNIESYYADYETYPTSNFTMAGYTTLGNEFVRITTGDVIQVNFNSDDSAYCLVGTNPRSSTPGGWYFISDEGGLQPTGTSSCGTY
jgi:prepilin-type N-terminal cleavage/methylation domain-containing protein